LRQTSSILFVAVDSLIPERGKSTLGLDELTAALDHAGIPAVWLTNRTRLQMDEPRRKHGHTHPFIAEGGSGIYLPEDYFHLRPDSNVGRSEKTTVRLGRFTCIPIAERQPAAAEALERLSEDSGVAVVTLRSLTPRELVQNSGLPIREAEFTRQRDFDELFFFAGASKADLERIQAEARERKLQLRPRGVLRSLAIGASTKLCLRGLSKLYERALRFHPAMVGIATVAEAEELFPFCERTILLTDRTGSDSLDRIPLYPRAKHLRLHTTDTWQRLLEAVVSGPSIGKKVS
jgi:hypothetical protein